MIHQAEIKWSETPPREIKKFESYFNSTNLSGAPLKDSIKVAAKQDAVILSVFKMASTALSPSQALTYCEIMGYKYIITSVRRSVTTLTKKGELIKTGEHIGGPNGKPEGLWIYWNSNSIINKF